MFSHHDTGDKNKIQSVEFSLDAYLDYVGLTNNKPIKPTLSSLQLIITHHLAAFNYQNSTLFYQAELPSSARTVPSLQINNVFKLMLEKKGGYCFQQLELMYAVLSAVGFHTNRHIAKTFISAYPLPDNSNKPKTHELLIVRIDDIDYIVDIGMANLSLRHPLMLKDGEQTFEDDQYRLTKKDDTWSLDCKNTHDSEWQCFYQFHNKPVNPEDIAACHHNLYASSVRLPIRDEMLLFGKTSPEKRKYLLWNRDTQFGYFKSVKLNHPDQVKTKKFDSLEKVLEFAEKKFKATQ